MVAVDYDMFNISNRNEYIIDIRKYFVVEIYYDFTEIESIELSEY